MKNKFFNTPKLKFLYSLLALQLIFYSVFRLLFLAYFHREMAMGTESLIFKALLMGLRFDLRLSCALLLPALIFINLPIEIHGKECRNRIKTGAQTCSQG